MSEKKGNTGGSFSELVEILSHEYRRRVLLAVAQQNPREEDHITSEMVAEEHELDDDAMEQLKLVLHHTHLPKLADAGFIDWNSDSGTITRGPRFEEIEPLLKLMHDHQDELPEDWP